MTYRQRARRIIAGATCLILDAELYAHDPRTPFQSLEDALTAALQLAVEQEREACAKLAEGITASKIRSRFRLSQEDSATGDPFGFSYDQD